MGWRLEHVGTDSCRAEGERVRMEEVQVAIKRATRRFARHQGNWFRQDDPRIAWHDAGAEPYAEILKLVQAFLARGAPERAPGPEPY